MSCACLSCAHLVSTVPPESIAFPSRNVCYPCLVLVFACLALVLCLSCACLVFVLCLFPPRPESIAFPSRKLHVLLHYCLVSVNRVLHRTKAVKYFTELSCL
jgi:hypothetical protein